MKLFTDQVLEPLTHLEGLTTFLKGTDEPVEVPDIGSYNTMSPQAREELNARRIAHLGSDLIIRTPQVRSVILKVVHLILLNGPRSSGRCGLMISGESGTGKTTAAKAAMRYVYARYRRDHPDLDRLGRVPVVYVEVPPGSTGKALAIQFARFLGLPVLPRDTLEYLLHLVSAGLIEAGTKLVVVDELHNLKRTNPGNSESVDVLKSLSNRIPATFVYVGINIHAGPYLADDRGRQVAGRFSLEQLANYGIANEAERNLWDLIVGLFEERLGLISHEPGDLAHSAKYLHERTKGSIGSLAHLLFGAAQVLIFTGSAPENERITREALDGISLDLATEFGGSL
ncbi:TniB family NTP-binding protein [Arthrobacter sp. ISL-65]|uniref:TniB family NTP-binding protein n=1 Tax=Arthrobacter sp. ISL-65 TaxID=2819112 RepID=UPI001BEA0A8B|nr:TniB family NTP-binding protein [Arthrobacter sp. ISL-65]MBT2546761.1 TniB family NTP-binding protein [Arthrobacter sp. ISL-65]